MLLTAGAIVNSVDKVELNYYYYLFIVVTFFVLVVLCQAVKIMCLFFFLAWIDFIDEGGFAWMLGRDVFAVAFSSSGGHSKYGIFSKTTRQFYQH